MKKILSLLISLTLVVGPVSAADVTDAYRTEGSGSEEGKKVYIKQAKMIAVAIVGSNMITCGGAAFSHIIWAAGAYPLVKSEKKYAKETTDYHRRSVEALKLDDSKLVPGTDEVITQAKADTQTAALQAAKAEEENNKKLIEERKKAVEKAIDVYEIANVIALTEILSISMLTCMPLLGIPLYLDLKKAYGLQEGEAESPHTDTGKKKYMKLLEEELVYAFAINIPSVIEGLGRSIYFYLETENAKKVAEDFQKRIDLATENIAKLEAAIAAWKANAKVTDELELGNNPPGPVTPSTNSSGSGTVATSGNYLNTNTSGGLPKLSGGCMGHTTAGVETSQRACKNPVKFKGGFGHFKLNGLNNFANNAIDFGNAHAIDDGLGAQIAGDAIGANAAKVRALKEQAIKDLNAEMARKGQVGFDFKALAKAKDLEMMKGFYTASNKSGFGSGSVGKGGFGAGGTAGKAVLDAEANQESKTSKSAVVVGAPKAAAAPKGEVIPPPEDFGANATGLTAAETEVIVDSYEKNKNEYLSNENDSLFAVITKTYNRNFNKILTPKKKEIEEAPKKDEE